MIRPPWSPKWPTIRSRRIRRVLVALIAASVAMTFVTPLAAFAVVLFPLVAGPASSPMGDLEPVDERQWRVRAEATIVAYRILAVTILVISLAELARSPLAWDKRLLPVLLLAGLLPGAVLAWREPTPPRDKT